MTTPTVLNYVTCQYGVPGAWAAGKHTGTDYRAPVGTKVFASRRGKVVHSGEGGYGVAYGNHIVIESRWGKEKRQHLYAHLSKNYYLEGQRVKTGACIGLSGVSGNVTGPHLHYEERAWPFGYWNYAKPVFPQWKPRSKIALRKIWKRKKSNNVIY